ncbi:hypothetical protein V1525DRAFT_395416 [Lipomyces kononenkoae]|uniref:Uncharacterized protein n=1 Tax=Lipomyces kononenkoae TaxID=34357 RepID=A0ACC3TA82_LIPKO
MSEPINANPKVLSLDQLPTRGQAREEIFGDTSSIKSTFPHSALDDVFPSKSIYESYSSLLVLSKDGLSDKDMEMQSPPDLSSGESECDDQSDIEEQEPIDEQEIYDLISTISDPEHPLTLGQLAVVNKPDIYMVSSDDGNGRHHKISKVIVEITPTITHCSLATLIGLGIRVRLERCLPPRFRIEIKVKKGTHQSESQVNKQLNDKERVAAACENQQLLGVLSGMLATCK